MLKSWNTSEAYGKSKGRFTSLIGKISSRDLEPQWKKLRLHARGVFPAMKVLKFWDRLPRAQAVPAFSTGKTSACLEQHDARGPAAEAFPGSCPPLFSQDISDRAVLARTSLQASIQYFLDTAAHSLWSISEDLLGLQASHQAKPLLQALLKQFL